MKRLCALPFIPTEMLQEALDIYDELLLEINQEEESLFSFATDLVSYIKRVWVHGPFSVQNLNLFNVGKFISINLYINLFIR